MNRVHTDAAAETSARQQIAALLIGEQIPVDEFDSATELDYLDADDLAEKVARTFAVTFHRYVNEHGVAVRRVVMYGPEECDPSAPATKPAEPAVLAVA